MSLYKEIWIAKNDLLRNRYLECRANIYLWINLLDLMHGKVDKLVLQGHHINDISIYRFTENCFIYLALKG